VDSAVASPHIYTPPRSTQWQKRTRSPIHDDVDFTIDANHLLFVMWLKIHGLAMAYPRDESSKSTRVSIKPSCLYKWETTDAGDFFILLHLSTTARSNNFTPLIVFLFSLTLSFVQIGRLLHIKLYNLLFFASSTRFLVNSTSQSQNQNPTISLCSNDVSTSSSG
jgi:hypothetical protein